MKKVLNILFITSVVFNLSLLPVLSNLSFQKNGNGVVYAAEESDPAGPEKEYGIQCFKKNIFQMEVGECIAVVGYYMYVPTGWILALSGAVFDTFLAFSLSKGLLNEEFVVGTWGIVRDLANLGLIFALIYISIATILQIGGVQLKKAVANVIIVALLVNFSYFFTRVVIDITNTFGFHFYTMAATAGKIQPSTAAQKHMSNAKFSDVPEYRISEGIMKGISPQSLMKKETFQKWYEINKQKSVLFVVFLLAAVVNLVAAFVLFSAAFLFLGRILAFVFLIIASPLAFVAWALPAGGGGFHSKWWKHLLDQGLVAPIFLFFIYVIIKMGEFSGGYFVTDVTGISLVDFLVVVLLKAILIIAALMLALNTTRDLGGKVGSMTAKIAGGAMVGTAAWAGRHTVGRAAKGLQDSTAMKRFVAKTGILGEALDKGIGATARGSMDIRAISGVDGLGSEGGKGGYDKRLQEQIKRKVELGKRLEKDKWGKPTHELAKDTSVLSYYEKDEQGRDILRTMDVRSGEKIPLTYIDDEDKKRISMEKGKIQFRTAMDTFTDNLAKQKKKYFFKTAKHKQASADRAAAVTLRKKQPNKDQLKKYLEEAGVLDKSDTDTTSSPETKQSEAPKPASNKSDEK